MALTPPANLNSQVVQLARPDAGQTITVPAGADSVLKLDFAPDAASTEAAGKDLVFSFPDDAKIVVSGFFDKGADALPSLELEDGSQLSGKDFLTAFNPDLLSTAAGPSAGSSPSSGSGAYSDDPGALLGGVNRLGSLGTDQWGRSTAVAFDPEDTLPPAVAPLIAITPGADPAPGAPPNSPAYALEAQGINLTVNERFLLNGSTPDPASQHATVAFLITSNDGVASITLTQNGVAHILTVQPDGTLSGFPAGGIAGTTGTLSNPQLIALGNGQYTLEFDYNFEHQISHPGAIQGTDTAGDVDSFLISATSLNGAVTGTVYAHIDVIDDIPRIEIGAPPAADDSVSLAEGHSVTGALDIVFGADGPHALEAFKVNGAVYTLGETVDTGEGSFRIFLDNGQYFYQYTAHADIGNATDSVLITVTDGDADIASDTLFLSISDVAVTPGPVTLTVFENALDTPLATGSNPPSPLETATASLGLPAGTTAADGNYDLVSGGAVIGFVTVSGGQVSYTLLDNAPHPDAGIGAPLLLGTATIPVTDAFGSTGAISVNVNVVDDIPSIELGNPGPDSASLFEGLTISGPVSIVFGADGPSAANAFQVNGAAYTLGDTVDTGEGNFRLFLNAGQYTYEYTAHANVGNVTDSVIITITDGDNDIASDTLNLTIADRVIEAQPLTLTVYENALDTIGSDPASPLETASITLGLPAGTTAADGTYDLLAADSSVIGFVTVSGGTASYTLLDNVTHPDAGIGAPLPLGTASIPVTDGLGSTGSVLVSVNVIDDVPSITIGAPLPVEEGINLLSVGGSTQEGHSLTGTVSLTFGADGAHATDAFKINGAAYALGDTVDTGTGSFRLFLDSGQYKYEYTAHANVGNATDSVTITITDGDNDIASDTLNLGISDVVIETSPVTLTVYENALNATGSDPASPLETASATLGLSAGITAADGTYDLVSAASIVIGFVTVTGGTVSYTLLDNVTHPDAGIGAPLPLGTATIPVTDGLGSTGTVLVNVNVVDDIPSIELGTPGPDSASLEEGHTATGLVNLVFGADGPHATDAFRVNGAAYTLGDTIDTGTGSFRLFLSAGQYTYEYTAHANVGNATDSVTIAITDGDNDIASDTLNLSIADRVIEAQPLTLTVYENALNASGSDPASPLETASAPLGLPLGITAADGTYDLVSAASIVIGFVTVTSGTVSYTLLDNIAHPDAGIGAPLPLGTATIPVTDGLGSTGTVLVNVNVVDDVPVLEFHSPGIDSFGTVDSGTIATLAGLDLRGGADGIASILVKLDSGAPVTASQTAPGSGIWVAALANGSTLTLDTATGQTSFAGGSLAAGPHALEVTVTDADGDTAGDTLQLTLQSPLDISISATDTFVHEAALPNGTGVDWIHNGSAVDTTAGGTFTITGTPVSVAISLGGTPTGITLPAALGGSASAVINGDTFSVTNTGGGTYAYTFTLGGPKTHGTVNDSAMGETVGIGLNITATGPGGTKSASTTITVFDDEITANSAHVDINEPKPVNYAITLVVDTSGSMAWNLTNSNTAPAGQSRLDYTKAALNHMLDQYAAGANGGAFVIHLVTFSDSTGVNQTYATIAAAKTAINDLSANGGTLYNTGLSPALTHAQNDLASYPGYEHKVYFLSDGEPNEGGAVPSAWQTFVNGPSGDLVDVYSVGIGLGTSGAGATAMRLAIDGSEGTGGDTYIGLTSASQLSAALEGTIESAAGNLLTGVLGADQPITLASISVGGTVIPITGSGETEIDLGQGVTLFVKADGTYRIEAAQGVDNDITFNNVTFNLKDADGDIRAVPVPITVHDYNPAAYDNIAASWQTVTPAATQITLDHANATSATAFTAAGWTRVGSSSVSYNQSTPTGWTGSNDLDTDSSSNRENGFTLSASGATLANVVSQLGYGANTNAAISYLATLGVTITNNTGQTNSFQDASIVAKTFALTGGSDFKFNYQFMNGRQNSSNYDRDASFYVLKDASGNTVAAGQLGTQGAATQYQQGVISVHINTTGNYTLSLYTLDIGSTTRGDARLFIEDIVQYTQPAPFLRTTGNVLTNLSPDGLADDLLGTAHLNDRAVLQSVAFGATEYAFVAGVATVPTPDGTLKLNLDGSYTFDANPGVTAVHADFTYTIGSPDGDTATADLHIRDAAHTFIGTAADNTLTGTTGDDVISGGAGNDTLSGGEGHDVIYGGNGNDTIHGDAGNDIIHGGGGNDILHGGDGNDTIYGDAGNDTIYGDAGNDLIYGGTGNDILVGGIGADTFVWKAADMDGGTDTVSDFYIDQDHLSLATLFSDAGDVSLDGLKALVEAGRLDLHATDGIDLTLTVHNVGNTEVLQTVDLHLSSAPIDAATIAALNSDNAEAQAQLLQHIITYSG